MTQRQADFFPARANLHVPNMQYASEVEHGGAGYVSLQDEGETIVELDADGILSAESIATAVDTTEFASTYSEEAMAKYGRNVTVVASGTATSEVTVHGTDYLGQLMSETFTLNGTTAVAGKKAFKRITRVEAGVTADRTINVGWGNALGLPFKLVKSLIELVDGATTANAGTIVNGVDVTQTATTGDPRGTYTPHNNNAPNASRTYRIYGMWDDGNLHGNKHYAA